MFEPTPKNTAGNMWRKYGFERALEDAEARTTSVFYFQSDATKAYWREVVRELKTLDQNRRARA
jgi:hypothetical protein